MKRPRRPLAGEFTRVDAGAVGLHLLNKFVQSLSKVCCAHVLTLLVIIVFIIAQRTFIEGISVTGLKG